MRQLVYLLSAERDLLDIAEYLVEASSSAEVALRFLTKLREQCAKLAVLPGTLGTARRELRHDLRSFPFKGYIILFRYADDRLEVVNIIEGHRDIESLYS